MNVKEGFWKFYGKHEGETGLVIANGPSLADVPVEFLKRYVTTGCNRITLMAPEFAPTYYTCIGRDQIDTDEKRKTMFPMLAHPDCKAAFLNRLYIHHFPFDEVYGIMAGSFYYIEDSKFFSYDPLNIIGLGATMTFAMLEIMYAMGFQKVLIVGLDHKYPKTSKKHFYDDSEVPLFGTAPGPFYNDDNETWQEVATAMLAMAEEAYRENGRQIINLTRNSACEVFRKEALSDWL